MTRMVFEYTAQSGSRLPPKADWYCKVSILFLGKF